MMDNDKTLTRAEIEGFCRLFIEGALSASEESDLATVLSLSKERGGIIDETIFLLGIQRSATVNNAKGSSGTNGKNASVMAGLWPWRKIFSRILAASVCAASLIAIVSSGWNVAEDDFADKNNAYTVYIDGKMVEDPDVARTLALESYRENMAMLERMKSLENLERRNIEQQVKLYDKVMNEINTYKNI